MHFAYFSNELQLEAVFDELPTNREERQEMTLERKSPFPIFGYKDLNKLLIIQKRSNLFHFLTPYSFKSHSFVPKVLHTIISNCEMQTVCSWRVNSWLIVIM